MLSMAHKSVCALIIMPFFNLGISLMRSKSVLLTCCLVVAQMSGDVLQTKKFVITFQSFSVANNLHFILPCKFHIDSYKSVTCCCSYLSIIAQLRCTLFIQEKRSFGCHLVSLVAYKLHIIRTSSLVTTSVGIAAANKLEYIHVFIEAHHYSWQFPRFFWVMVRSLQNASS